MPTKRTPSTPSIPKPRALPVYLTIEEAAEIMKTAPLTIRRRISDGWAT